MIMSEKTQIKSLKGKELETMEKQKRSTARGFKMDTIKFVALLKRTGESAASCSRALGFCDSAVNTAIRSGSMSYGMADRLAKQFRIYKEDYELVEKEEEPKKEEPVTNKIEFVISETTKTELKEIIYSAMYEAMKKALSE